MNKGLEALEEIGKANVVYYRNGIDCSYAIKDTEEYDTIEKELRVFEIIKKKRVQLDTLLLAIESFGSFALSQYNAVYGNEVIINGVKQPDKHLTQEEFILLKEYFQNEIH